MKTSEYLELGRKYRRLDLRKSFGITDETIKTGIFRPKGHSSIWLFITKDNSKHGYADDIVGNQLTFSGQVSHKSDTALVQHTEKGWELVVFYRAEGMGPFTYCGRAEYIRHQLQADQPTQFVARLLDMARDEATSEFKAINNQDTVKEKVRFVADTHLIKVLGEQLIASEKVGVLELIKNAYDAGATLCQVIVEKVPSITKPLSSVYSEIEWSDSKVKDLAGPVITVVDNGSGMDYQTVINGWLRPATTIKTSAKERLREERQKADQKGTRASYERLVDSIKTARGGRLPLGEKGVGRFACHRLGKYLQLHTKTASDSREWKLTIDWNKFDEISDQPIDLSSIDLDLVHQPPEIDYGATNSGTRLRIYGGREGFEWNEEILRDIGYAVSHLRSPVRTPEGFDVEFICPQLGEIFEVPTRTVHAPFRCIALVEKGKADIEIEFIPPPSLDVPLPSEKWSFSKEELRTDNKYWAIKGEATGNKSTLREPQCGPFFLDVKCWIRRATWIHSADTAQFTQYLDRFGGIGVFRDGLAILPAQDGARIDWLNLSKRIISRGKNISYYNLAGSVEITQDENLNLVDQTNRQGLLQTIAYYDLAKLIEAVIYILNEKVIETRDAEERLRFGPGIPKATLNKQVRTTEKVLEKLSKDYDFKKDPAGISEILGQFESGQKDSRTHLPTPSSVMSELKSGANLMRREIERLAEQLNALLEITGYAISIGVALHEIQKITENLYHGLNRVARLTGKDTEAHERAVNLSRVAQGLLNELRRIAPLRVTRLEKKQRFSVRDAIIAASGAFQLHWDNEGVKFGLPPKADDFSIFGSFGACSQVFANLFDNATYWLIQTEVSKRSIGAFIYPDMNQVLIADSGPGIADNIREHLFEPFYSMKSPPSGLGLYICRYYMRQLKGGDIRLARPAERLSDFPGAQFTVIFPKDSSEGE